MNKKEKYLKDRIPSKDDICTILDMDVSPKTAALWFDKILVRTKEVKTSKRYKIPLEITFGITELDNAAIL